MHNSDNKRVTLIVWGIIVALSSLVYAMMSTPIKQTIFMPQEAFFFGSDGVSIIISGIAIFLIGVCLVIAGLSMINKKLKWRLFAGLLTLSIALLVITFDEYYYYSPEGVYTNGMTGFGTEHTKWEEIALITSIYVKDEAGVTLPKELIFELKNGETLSMSLKGQLYHARNQIDATVRSVGGDSITKIIDPEGNVLQESLTEGREI